jgi:hypothetical protein
MTDMKTRTRASRTPIPGTIARAAVAASAHPGKERQAAGAAAGHDGGYGWPMHDSYEPGYVLATMLAGTVAGHAGWQPACTRTGVGPERRLPRAATGGTR